MSSYFVFLLALSRVVLGHFENLSSKAAILLTSNNIIFGQKIRLSDPFVMLCKLVILLASNIVILSPYIVISNECAVFCCSLFILLA